MGRGRRRGTLQRGKGVQGDSQGEPPMMTRPPFLIRATVECELGEQSRTSRGKRSDSNFKGNPLFKHECTKDAALFEDRYLPSHVKLGFMWPF
jgi:hypothetical protein